MMFFLTLFLFLVAGSAALKTITILPLEGRSLSTEQAMVYTKKLSSLLVQSQAFKIMKRKRMGLIYNEQGLQKSGSTSEQMKIGQLLEVNEILTDSFSQTEKKTMFVTNLIHIETGTITQSTEIEYYGSLPQFLFLGIPLIKSLITKITKLLETPFNQDEIAKIEINKAYFVLNHPLLFPMKT